MPLTDIARVTTAIATLIRQALARDNITNAIDVTAAPPDDETNTSPNVISLYLFHIAEDPFHKNLPPRRPVLSDSPAQFTEMALVLNYVITARNSSATSGGDRALNEQRLLGFVARALHDFPLITDKTVVPAIPPKLPNPPVFQTANILGADNRIELVLRPVSIEETVNFWTAEQDLVARLALFYEARVLLLSTPPVTSTPSIVYSLGGFVSVAGQPFLESVQNLVGFVPPPGFAPPDPSSPFQLVSSNPARVALFPAGAVPAGVAPDNNRFRIDGAELRGEQTFLALRGQAGVGAAAPTERSFRVDVGVANPGWAFDVRGTEITVSMRQAVTDDAGTALVLYPGLYSLRVITARPMNPPVSDRAFEQSSNELAFAVTPQVVAVAGVGGQGAARRFRLTLFGSYLRDELDIQLSVGGEVLRRDADTTTAGNYDFPDRGPARVRGGHDRPDEPAAGQPHGQRGGLDAGLGGLPVTAGRTTAAAVEAAPAPEPIELLDAVLVRVRALAQRRLLWLESIADSAADSEAEADTTAYAALPVRLRIALLDLDAPHDEARFYRRDPRCHELTERATAYADAIADSSGTTFRHLVEVLDATPAEADLLQVCLAAQLDPGLAQILGYLEGDVERRSHATEALAARLCGYGRASMWSPAGALARWQVLEADATDAGGSPPLRLDPSVLHFLQGSAELDPELLDCAAYVRPRAPLPRWPVEEVSRRVAEAVARGLPSRVWLVGQRRSGRRTFAACVADHLRTSLVAVDTARIEERHWARVQVRVRRHALLHGCAVAWYGRQVTRACAEGGAKLPLEFAVVEPPGEGTAEPGWREERVELPRLLSAERGRLWESFLPASRTWPEESRRRLAERYTVQVGEIAHVAVQSPESFDEVRRLARELSRGRLDDLGHLLHCPFRRADLQLPESLSRLLDEFLFEARDRTRFWENEQARRLFPRGTGLVALMSGPPGTGKTMAAQVVAAELELDLYRIDLASTVDKYIGETAKNLKRLFARAADMNAVLLFDEADALFSKRTEVRDSHDRYANADTTYLLQLIEDYPGVALLASNKRQNIDEAFVRRVRYLMFFPRPDAGQRLAIWRQIVRELAGEQREQALAAELEQAAVRVEATGAQIKNAVLAATFLARQAGHPLSVAELRHGLERELANQGGYAAF